MAPRNNSNSASTSQAASREPKKIEDKRLFYLTYGTGIRERAREWIQVIQETARRRELNNEEIIELTDSNSDESFRQMFREYRTETTFDLDDFVQWFKIITNVENRSLSPYSRFLKVLSETPRGTFNSTCDAWLKVGADIYTDKEPLTLTRLVQRVFMSTIKNPQLKAYLHALPPPRSVNALVGEARAFVEKNKIPMAELDKDAMEAWPILAPPPGEQSTPTGERPAPTEDRGRKRNREKRFFPNKKGFKKKQENKSSYNKRGSNRNTYYQKNDDTDLQKK
ncbi:hypothetical protein EJF18_30054 [Clavispora lusitaniae]|uniref:Uncharacterized protein n=3 Tax=Clavispora lusitaniae TaxID=36911 RepID=A0ACD0WIM5_CLALS|nr:hypothetical protein EJF14_20732 [Clavispora lusitaniae]QFZ27100.1 hypothetical protein EJF14_30054 [Clavispora lusitaniae]QFZ27140.1 hypothetical protein EJF14_30098 [Clavispora lusitaniae]QFZ32482.1 hypothetical protein EJF16_20732 [Clavispora lusitaniae]QFZ33552.1 hypothetical protein EJF16_30054 [Clavispora lusitaniae]